MFGGKLFFGGEEEIDFGDMSRVPVSHHSSSIPMRMRFGLKELFVTTFKHVGSFCNFVKCFVLVVLCLAAF